MKNKLSSFVVVFLFLAAIFSGERSYKNARHSIVRDLNNAMSATLANTQSNTITPDTAAVLRENLTISVLKDSAYIAYCLPGDKPKGICSDTMMLDKAAVRSYADVTFSSVFGLADKRMPAAFTLLALFWMLGSMMLTKRCQHTVFAQLTPMQRQLVDMFLAAPDGELSKKDICNALWPNKPQPEDTLYSLIRHLKAVLDGSGYEIETRRGFGYRLIRR